MLLNLEFLRPKKKNTYIYMYVYICVCIQHIHIYIINFQKNPSIPWYNAKEEIKISLLIG